MEEPMPQRGLPRPAPGERHLVVAGLTEGDRAVLADALDLAVAALGGGLAELPELEPAIEETVRARELGAFPALLLGSRLSDERVERAARGLADAAGVAPVVRWTPRADEVALPALLAAGCCDVLDRRRGTPDDLVRALRLAFEISRRRSAESRLARRRVEPELSPELVNEARRYAAAGRMLVSIGHDLNNLLQPIEGYLELLSERIDPGGQEAEMVAVMRRAAGIAAALVQRLQQLGRVSEVVRLRIAPDRLLESLDPLVRTTAGQRVRLDVVLGAPGARLSLAAGALEQIVLNLVANARDAMPEGGSLELRSARVAGSWTLTVVDTGTGVAVAETSRLFESGFTTKQRAGGAGLGLWIVRSLVEEAGGSVEIGNAPSRGTRVTVRIPLSPAG